MPPPKRDPKKGQKAPPKSMNSLQNKWLETVGAPPKERDDIKDSKKHKETGKKSTAEVTVKDVVDSAIRAKKWLEHDEGASECYDGATWRPA
jgi:hypothetical protein